MGIYQELAEDIVETRTMKGFFTPDNIDKDCDLMLGKLALVASEVGELLEALEKMDKSNIDEEIADFFIRIFDISCSMGLDVDTMMDFDLDFNILKGHFSADVMFPEPSRAMMICLGILASHIYLSKAIEEVRHKNLYCFRENLTMTMRAMMAAFGLTHDELQLIIIKKSSVNKTRQVLHGKQTTI